MQIEEAQEIYYRKFGQWPSVFGLDPEDRAWVDEQIELAALGERGELTQKEVNKKFNVAPRSKTQKT